MLHTSESKIQNYRLMQPLQLSLLKQSAYLHFNEQSRNFWKTNTLTPKRHFLLRLINCTIIITTKNFISWHNQRKKKFKWIATSATIHSMQKAEQNNQQRWSSNQLPNKWREVNTNSWNNRVRKIPYEMSN